MPPLTRDELVQHLAIRMAATNRNPPILRSKASPRDAFERDRLRREFAEWFVRECVETAGLTIIATGKTFEGSDHAGFARPRATPPQLFAS